MITRAGISHSAGAVYQVGAFVLDPSRRQLTCGGQVVELTGLHYAVLECLIVNAPAYVSKDTLAKEGWNGHASDNRIEKAVSELRQALGHTEGSKYIETERSEEHTSELQSQSNLVCRLLLEK